MFGLNCCVFLRCLLTRGLPLVQNTLSSIIVTSLRTREREIDSVCVFGILKTLYVLFVIRKRVRQHYELSIDTINREYRYDDGSNNNSNNSCSKRLETNNTSSPNAKARATNTNVTFFPMDDRIISSSIDTENILYVGSIGCVIFTLFVILVAITGAFSSVRDDNGKFKIQITIKSLCAFGSFLIFLLTMLLWSNLRYISIKLQKQQHQQNHQRQEIETTVPVSITNLWINSFCTFMIVNTYDLIVLDWLIVVKWHPKWANMPNTPYFTTMKPHIQGFLRGIIIGLLFSGFVSIVGLPIYYNRFVSIDYYMYYLNNNNNEL